MPPGKARDLLIDKYFKVEKWQKETQINTGELKAISDFTGLSFKEIEDLTYYEYCLYRRDAWVFLLNQSEEGREFLKTTWRLTQTKADLQAVRDFNQRR